MTRLSLTPYDRRDLLDLVRRSSGPEVRLRSHILVLRADGHPWVTIAAVLFCSTSTITRWKDRFEAGGVDTVFGRPRGRKPSVPRIWADLVVRWVLAVSPTTFRFARSRWSCEAVAVVLRDDYQVTVGRETVRRWLREAGLVWRRPRPTIRPTDPDREKKLRALRALLHRLPANETAMFMDEVDVNLNPKVGCQWMTRGEQAAVETPGNNEARYLAGSIHWRTGRVILTEGKAKEGRGAALFCRHLDDLRRAFRQYKVIHVIGDNAGTHTPEGSKLVRAYLAEWGDVGWHSPRKVDTKLTVGLVVRPFKLVRGNVPQGGVTADAVHVSDGHRQRSSTMPRKASPPAPTTEHARGEARFFRRFERRPLPVWVRKIRLPTRGYLPRRPQSIARLIRDWRPRTRTMYLSGP